MGQEPGGYGLLAPNLTEPALLSPSLITQATDRQVVVLRPIHGARGHALASRIYSGFVPIAP
jgi:hypothetical protein